MTRNYSLLTVTDIYYVILYINKQELTTKKLLDCDTANPTTAILLYVNIAIVFPWLHEKAAGPKNFQRFNCWLLKLKICRFMHNLVYY